eukprot:TRINITY_DN732_c0_g1_i7.p1 TRINITY_DN732_c0_g1~~TRINITY_DN732_c0_g1_i7.p1  ORF type:complete len:647 (+),score=261.70 TRINITY_DN732_c0_g1_i7:174-2114(+)
MDSMDLEREKGITIASAATHCAWKGHDYNIIDTPGHVDFTIEVERSLRVLDGAVLVLCGVSGVQSQTITVDRQMRRYNVPRLTFINKLDRQGANPMEIVKQLNEKLHHNAAAVQLPIGLEDELNGVVDLITNKALYFEGDFGEKIKITDIPADMEEQAVEMRQHLIGTVAEVDEVIADRFLSEEEPTEEEMRAAIRKATIAQTFSPVFMGSAFKNVGVQPLLDAINDFLPNPTEVENYALDLENNEEPVLLETDNKKPFVGLAFKLEEGRFGQLTYMRVYQGTMKRGDTVYNISTGKKIKVPRLVRMHADEMEDIDEAPAGEICAMFGVDCASGDTFASGDQRVSMTSMHVPAPVISLAVKPVSRDSAAQFSKALNRFQKEDPTFRVHMDKESGETIISGMGELHLEIYAERMKREYNCEVEMGAPKVAYRETINRKAEFNYTHKKQSGGAGQFARVEGYLEPLPEDHEEDFEFLNHIVGGSIPPQYLPGCEKGFNESVVKGALTGSPVVGVRAVLTDGAHHAVDSSELAFKVACQYAFREAFQEADPVIKEPIMRVEAEIPMEFQGSVIGDLNRRKGIIENTEQQNDYVRVTASVPLQEMFGYSTDLRSATEGKGEFTMEYLQHAPVARNVQEQLISDYQKSRNN